MSVTARDAVRRGTDLGIVYFMGFTTTTPAICGQRLSHAGWQA